MKLFANQFIKAYYEFDVLQEVSVKIMNEMGVFPKMIKVAS